MAAYVGRFAPSPTGPLHLGSLICALASYLEARHQQGRWLVRMEDLDPPREQRGAAHRILNSLRAHGLQRDGEELWQSDRHDAYQAAVDQLLARRLAFHCDCSRARLAPHHGIYQGRCRDRVLADEDNTAIRARLEGDVAITIADQLQRPLTQDLSVDVGDFVIRRRDGLFAYQLAVVLDDDHQEVSHVLRGSDLYDSTPRQVYLQRLFGLDTPAYCHIPVLVNSRGQKLSKQTGASELDDAAAGDNLRQALAFLAQPTPPAGCKRVSEVLSWASAHWQLARVPGQLSAPFPAASTSDSPGTVEQGTL